jgi:phytoene synthase
MTASKIPQKVKQGFQKAKEITRKHAKSFYFASLFLPPQKRNAAYSVYALCRLSDDSVDSLLAKPAGLERLKTSINSAYEGSHDSSPLLAAFSYSVNRNSVPKKYFDSLLKGVAMDLTQKRYSNFDRLYCYCYKVAGVVGLIIAAIFGLREEKSELEQATSAAVSLGVAMQLTNILRDLREDYSLGRIYLPQDEMHRFKVSEEQIACGTIDENFIRLLNFQIKRARQYYQSSKPGIKLLSGRRCRLVVCLMKDIYSGILNSIEKNKFDVFTQRAQVNFWGKLKLTLRTLLKGEYL